MTSVKERAEKAEQREAEKLTRKDVLEKRREREYFSQPKLKVGLFPTLLSCCTGAERGDQAPLCPRG